MFAAGIGDVTLVPLNATHQGTVSAETVQGIEALGSRAHCPELLLVRALQRLLQMTDTRAFCAGAADAVSRCSEVMMGWTDGAPFPCHDLLAIMSTVEPDVLQEYATKPADDSCLLFVRSLLLRKLSGFVFTDCAGW